MDVAITSETLLNDRDYRWLASSHLANATQPATVLLSAATKATHYPNGFIKRGTILSKFTSGANQGLWAPHVSDDTVAEGLGVPAGIVMDGFKVNRDSEGAEESTVTAGAVVLAGIPLQIFVASLPGLLLEDGTTAYAPVAGDLPSGMVAVSL